MKPIYIFSGLGADERVFKNLDWSGFAVTFITWIPPTSGETIEKYARRLGQQITQEKPVLIGLSFGGIMAVEVAKLIPTEKVILIASAKTRQEIPFYYRLAGQLRLHKLLPTAWMKRPTVLSNWFFCTHSKADRQLLATILRETDPAFLSWAIDQIVTWTHQTPTPNLIHIHGQADRILPFRYVKGAIPVVGGGHFMTINKAEELTSLLRSLL
ncbi:pimeloyl-ACP methyl ester carboxylesterase [Larkinella arboricola]|uniref:Pimeloyl-ACP methyl ester carboxylesterase n=1 Tax=Larkinella arboricola TaxID=643671 RepID=A0A327WQK9_LARAB|nr:alpha/beta hydrolase [Larkinella arboricola]RAJ93187.1 pimeloyl-ACP methyl ester carboxylesterase [Larkinella arboricola]